MGTEHLAKNISRVSWGSHAGKDVYLFRLVNAEGSYVELTNYGATLVSVVVPDTKGVKENVVLGFPLLEGYQCDQCYIGSTVGRFANRIGGAQFTLSGKAYTLDRNDYQNTNHGGYQGFHAQVFDYTLQDNGITFTLSSADGEGGFPGNVQLRVSYTWNDDQQLQIGYEATTDQTTVLNFTNHAYFNLSACRYTILDHRLQIDSSSILETTSSYIPTGAILPAGKYSFEDETRLGDKIVTNVDNRQGLNHYYIFRDNNQKDIIRCRLSDPESGRVLEVYTSYPGVQVYSGDFLSSISQTHHANAYKPFEGICLECQYFPDSPNHAHFPSTVLNPGERYEQKIIYQFSVATV
jgi:aldose 1-epimerase